MCVQIAAAQTGEPLQEEPVRPPLPPLPLQQQGLHLQVQVCTHYA